MFGLGATELIIVLVIVLVLFGRGRITAIMGEFGKGIKAFKGGLNDDAKLSEKTEDDKKDS